MFPIKPSRTPAQIAERRRREAELAERYPGQVVAYLDTWDGDRLTREVVVASPDSMAFQKRLSELPPEVRGRVQLTHVPEHSGSLDCPSTEVA